MSADTGTKAKAASPIPKAPVPAYLAGTVQPLPDNAGETDSILQKDSQRAALERKAAERYLTSLKTADGRVIGTFQTSLAGHKATGRVKNIQLASQKLNGTVLLPGEPLSFNEILGDSNDPAGGWQLATVIVGREFVDGYGGGICQVSTTLYNSVRRWGWRLFCCRAIVARNGVFFRGGNGHACDSHRDGDPCTD